MNLARILTDLDLLISENAEMKLTLLQNVPSFRFGCLRSSFTTKKRTEFEYLDTFGEIEPSVLNDL